MSNEQQQLLRGNPQVLKIVRSGSENERSTFLLEQNKPVSLTPSWEAQKLPNDDLNFKGD